MELSSELKDTITESKQAKLTKDKWVADARNQAGSHVLSRALWSIIVFVLILCVGGMYINALSVVSDYVSKVYGWVGLANYSLYISIALIVLGLIRIVYHSNMKSQQLNFANQIESMSLSAFRREYM